MTASATPVIVGALLFLCVAATVALGAAFYGWRWARRRLLIARAAWRGVERTWMATRTGRTVLGGWHHLVGAGTAGPAGNGRTIPLPELRRQLWQGVGDADRAVRDAAAAGAPVGDLPSLQRRLRSTATALDGLLATARRSAPVRRPPAGRRRAVDGERDPVGGDRGDRGGGQRCHRPASARARRGHRSRGPEPGGRGRSVTLDAMSEQADVVVLGPDVEPGRDDRRLSDVPPGDRDGDRRSRRSAETTVKRMYTREVALPLPDDS